MPWSCLRAASQAETQADRTHASRKPDSPCDTELGRTTSDTPLDRSCIGLMRVLANGSKVLTGWSSRMANCFCFGLTLCISSQEVHAWAELCLLGHGPRAEAIVAHATARMFFPAGERRGWDSAATNWQQGGAHTRLGSRSTGTANTTAVRTGCAAVPRHHHIDHESPPPVCRAGLRTMQQLHGPI